MDELVIVAVNECVGVVVEDTARDMVELAPVILALFVVLGGRERAGVKVKNQDVAPHGFLVSRVVGQLDLGCRCAFFLQSPFRLL